jgi:hypothetical protein
MAGIVKFAPFRVPQRAPSPACGGGVGRGHFETLRAPFPLPVPPPQAGEGTLEQTLVSTRRV